MWGRHRHPGERADAAPGVRAASLDLLFGDDERARAGARLVGERFGWTAAVALCSDWGALPQLGGRLEALDLRLDAPARETFRRWSHAVFLRSAARLHGGAQALAALSRAGVDAAAFKGVAAVATIYRGARDRTLGDTDVLVRRADVNRAVTALEPAGFRAAVERGIPDPVAFVQRHPNAGNESVSLLGANGVEVDLHWQMGRVCVAEVLAGARPADVYGTTIRVVSDAHGFLLAVHHVLRNGFELDRAVRDLFDARGWLDAVVERTGPEPLVRPAASWGLAAPALAVIQILAHFRPTSATAAASAAFLEGMPASDRRLCEALRECFLLQSSAGAWNVDVLRALRVADIARFVDRAFAGRSSYTRTISAPHPEPQPARSLPQRLRRFGQALPRTRWRLVFAVKAAQDRAFDRDRAPQI